MANKPTRRINAGTGSDARPGVGDSSTTTDDWEPDHPGQLDPHGATEPPAGARLANAQSSWRRAVTGMSAVAAVVAVFSAGVLYANLTSPRETAAAVTPARAPELRAAPAPRATATVLVQAPSNVPVVTQPAQAVRGAPPTRISIPALKVNQRLIGLRVTANRQLEVPQNYDDIGWWSTGPVAGDQGAAVVVGHVDSAVGPAVFYRLSTLATGTPIVIRRADGSTVTFRVTKRETFAKEHFPDKLVYRTTGKPSLHLVTCGGTYNRTTGYRDNVVVFADLVQPRRPSKPNATSKAAHHQPNTAHQRPNTAHQRPNTAHQRPNTAHPTEKPGPRPAKAGSTSARRARTSITGQHAKPHARPATHKKRHRAR